VFIFTRIFRVADFSARLNFSPVCSISFLISGESHRLGLRFFASGRSR
jgi:hypothetical protein